MLEVLPTVLICIILAYCSQNRLFSVQITEKYRFDIPLFAIILILGFFVGLRNNYNDTSMYIRNFKIASTVDQYLETAPDLVDNPLFYSFVSYFRHSISDNHHLYLLTISFFTNTSLILFIKKYSTNFTLSLVIFFAIGLFYDTMGAMKQTLAIAILTYALRALFKKKYLVFYIIVFIAMLFHTYAVFFAILPLFMNKPWSLFTYVTIVGVIVVLFSFQSALDIVLSAAEETGKSIDTEGLMHNLGINPLRLAVFGIPPLLSFIFQKQLETKYTREKSILLNMGIISFLIMLMGIFNGANLFGRFSGYFEIGSIIMLPWIIDEIFDDRSVQMASLVVGLCYIAFFTYLSIGFDAKYSSVTLGQFINSLQA
ncbi:MAG: EpsG family protein [Ruminococcaceae bacterium]|nr:EpsG family protein [Oscillospiraceae bacterium]